MPGCCKFADVCFLGVVFALRLSILSCARISWLLQFVVNVKNLMKVFPINSNAEKYFVGKHEDVNRSDIDSYKMGPLPDDAYQISRGYNKNLLRKPASPWCMRGGGQNSNIYAWF